MNITHEHLSAEPFRTRGPRGGVQPMLDLRPTTYETYGLRPYAETHETTNSTTTWKAPRSCTVGSVCDLADFTCLLLLRTDGSVGSILIILCPQSFYLLETVQSDAVSICDPNASAS